MQIKFEWLINIVMWFAAIIVIALGTVLVDWLNSFPLGQIVMATTIFGGIGYFIIFSMRADRALNSPQTPRTASQLKAEAQERKRLVKIVVWTVAGVLSTAILTGILFSK